MMTAVKKKELITIRDFHPADKNFIFATWLRGLRYGNEWFGEIDQETYFTHYHRIVEELISRPTAVVQVACLVEDPDVILGYSVSEHLTLHWVWVKPVWRRIGIAKDLTPKNIEFVSHLTKIGKTIKQPEWRFNPFL